LQYLKKHDVLRGTKTITLMRKTILPVFLFTLLVTTWSCKKDDEPITENPVTYDDYACLKTGNYWIYQQFTVDSLGNATPTDKYDSCYIEKDTVVDGKIYYKMIRPLYAGMQPTILYLRDSLHYVVGITGSRYFSSQDFSSVFYYGVINFEGDTIAEQRMQMANPNTSVSVPAGTFTTHDCQTQFQFHPPYNFNGNVRYQHARYAKNKGIVLETLPFFLSNPNFTERRLVRSYIQ